MKNKKTFSCIIVGRTTLPIRCAQTLLNEGHEILAIFSTDPEVQKWSEENRLACLDPRQGIDTQITEPFDYLFSIVNQQILSRETLQLPRKAAINYHDGPLPKYAGSHATSWALLNGETLHGITWHSMTEAVDAGDIYKQSAIAINPDDTAGTLNFKCYDAAARAFAELVEDLSSGNLRAIKQDLRARSFYARSKKPPRGGVISWDRPAAEISALVRALDFGDFPNALCAAKLAIEECFLVVGRARMLGTPSTLEPGTITKIAPESIQVSTSDYEIELGELRKLDGQSIPTNEIVREFGLFEGFRFKPLDTCTCERIEKAFKETYGQESYWVEKLSSLYPPDLPYGSTTAGDTPKYERLRISLPTEVLRAPHLYGEPSSSVVMAAFTALIFRLVGSETFHLTMGNSEVALDLTGLENLFEKHPPLRISLNGSKSFMDFLREFKTELETVENARTYCRGIYYRYPRLTKVSAGRPPLPIAIVRADRLAEAIPTTGVDLALLVDEPLSDCELIFNRNRIDAAAAITLSKQFEILFTTVLARPECAVADLPILTAEERQKVLVEWNGNKTEKEQHHHLFQWNNNARPYLIDKCIHSLFEEQALRTPEGSALVFGNDRLTYRDLNQRANQLAHHLQHLGVGAESLVGICVERSLEMVVGILGILKAGGAYLPLDPSWPKERIEYVLEDSQAKALVTRTEHRIALDVKRTTIVCLDRDEQAIRRNPLTNPEAKTRPNNLAYVIYTSGSTGAPKGTEVQHDSLVNYAFAIRDLLKIEQPLQFATVSTIAADLGNTCVFPSLMFGGCLHVIDYDTSMSAERFGEYTKRCSIDVLKITPSHFKALMGSDEQGFPLPSKYLILGGEALSVEMVKRITSRQDMTCTIINHYGPTEATVGSLTSVVHPGQSFSSATVPIGRPIANAQAYILDVNRQPVPVGVSGELYLGGVGLARGYRRRPELTDEKFVPNPFAPDLSERLYRTGDLARYHPSGEIEYLGRIDNQVKIRGFRVELEEVEAAISTHTPIKETAVIAKEVDPTERILVAYFVSDKRQSVKIDDLRKHLARTLPDHMIPPRFFELDELPLTRNGKVDRKALADRPLPRVGSSKRGPTPLRDELERKLLEIWESILGVDSIDVNDNFFELGGHSLQAVRMFAEVEQTFGKNIPLATLFEAGTIERLANVLRSDGWSAPESSLVPIQPHGTKPIFFCVHAKGGNVLFYRDLARHLGTDQPFYGIQARRVGGRQVAHSTVEEMAAFYIKEIRGIQPEGPYYIGGSSFGGLAAFEMAQQLAREGHKVALLALLDTGTGDYPEFLPTTSTFRRKIYDRIRQGQKHVNSLMNLDARGKARYAFDKAKKVDLRLRRKVRNTYKKTARTLYLKVKGAGSIPKQYFQIEDQIARAGQIYSPRPYMGHVTLFRAAHQPFGIYPDPTLGWGKYVEGSLEIHEVPGHHGSIVAEPYVKVLAEKLTMSIDRAQKSNFVEDQRSGKSGVASVSV